MKYKVGDKVRIRKDLAAVDADYNERLVWGGKVMTICEIEELSIAYYTMREDEGQFYWDDNDIEGLAEPERKKKKEGRKTFCWLLLILILSMALLFFGVALLQTWKAAAYIESVDKQTVDMEKGLRGGKG